MPLEALDTRAAQRLSGNPQNFLLLAANYDMLVHNPAWQDLFGRLHAQHQSLVTQIMLGEVDRQGNDLTPTLRRALRVLEDVITIPAKIKAMQTDIENTMGTPSP